MKRRKIILTRTMNTVGGRTGTLQSDDKTFSLKLDLPKEMGGQPAPHTTDPEQLFATGYAACFASSLEYILMSEQVVYQGLETKATAVLVKDDALGGFKFAIDLVVSIAGLTPLVARPFIDKAYAFCPYSKAIRGNVDVAIEVR